MGINFGLRVFEKIFRRKTWVFLFKHVPRVLNFRRVNEWKLRINILHAVVYPKVNVTHLGQLRRAALPVAVDWSIICEYDAAGSTKLLYDFPYGSHFSVLNVVHHQESSISAYHPEAPFEFVTLICFFENFSSEFRLINLCRVNKLQIRSNFPLVVKSKQSLH